MGAQLPQAFEQQMERWLGSNWPELSDALAEPPARAIRLHRVADNRQDPGRTASLEPHSAAQPGVSPSAVALSRAPLPLPANLRAHLEEPVPWTEDGFYIPLDSELGKSIYHETGAFYIQEPSAMAIVAALDPQPGERVLDLCAAPGGKSTAIGRRMRGQGLFVANEIHPTRVLALAENIERLGVSAVISNESPQRLAAAWPHQFDAILVDAPCSGEGMFRKDDGAIAAWSPDAPALCAARQRDILPDALTMLRPGGRLVYSTCTFNPLENEQIAAWLMDTFDLELLPLPDWPGWRPAEPDFADGRQALLGARRLWPQHARGEGHFVALFRKPEASAASTPKAHRRTSMKQDPAALKAWRAWVQQGIVPEANLPATWQDPMVQGAMLFANDAMDLPTDRLKILRPGTTLAKFDRERLEPHHALAMALASDAAALDLELSESEAISYASGVALPDLARDKGIHWIHIEGLPMGWGKAIPGRVNNLYPKGLRRTDLRVI